MRDPRAPGKSYQFSLMGLLGFMVFAALVFGTVRFFVVAWPLLTVLAMAWLTSGRTTYPSLCGFGLGFLIGLFGVLSGAMVPFYPWAVLDAVTTGACVSLLVGWLWAFGQDDQLAGILGLSVQLLIASTLIPAAN